jgi:hypothetical protein
VMNVLWVPKLKRNVIPFLVVEKKGFGIAFQDGKELINPRGSISYKEVVFGVRESKLV